MKAFETEILVVGGGGAGMSAAAAAAENGLRVAVVDDNPSYGGQIWRQDVERQGPPKAKALIARLETGKVAFLPGTTVIDREGENALIACGPNGQVKLRYQKLVIATGARERFIPFRGWTLPNVFGAGGLQSLVKGGMSVENKRVIVAGTGPLLHAVADYLTKRRAEILFVAEQAEFRTLAAFALRLALYPAKFLEAAKMRMGTGVHSIKTGAIVSEALGGKKLEAVKIDRGGKTVKYDCDILASGFHLVPNLELPLLLECSTEYEGVVVDEWQSSSVENIFAAGESTGIGGIELSCIEGTIAGLAAAGNLATAKHLFKQRDRYTRFAEILNRAFAVGENLKASIDDDTFVCRCEDVAFGSLKNFINWRDAKLQTRCGMGPCQGRICGPATKYLFGWASGGVRPPLFPVKLKDLGGSS